MADASHELRSPLTRIRTELEVDASHPETADLAATHRSVLDETRKLQSLIDDLLLLARHDASTPGQRTAGHRLVPLDDVVRDEAHRLATTTTVAIDTTAVEAARVTGDPDHLARAVRNLLDNAARYATSTISIALTETSEAVQLSISDDGPGIDPTHRHRIFERFTRLDPARTALRAACHWRHRSPGRPPDWAWPSPTTSSSDTAEPSQSTTTTSNPGPASESTYPRSDQTHQREPLTNDEGPAPGPAPMGVGAYLSPHGDRSIDGVVSDDVAVVSASEQINSNRGDASGERGAGRAGEQTNHGDVGAAVTVLHGEASVTGRYAVADPLGGLDFNGHEVSGAGVFDDDIECGASGDEVGRALWFGEQDKWR